MKTTPAATTDNRVCFPRMNQAETLDAIKLSLTPEECFIRRGDSVESLMSEIALLRQFCETLVSMIGDTDEHVAYLKYRHNTRTDSNTIQTCDQDAPGAFKVYRHPKERP